MQTRTHVVYYPSRKTIFRLYYLTDLHIGAKACDERQLKRDIETIKNDPYALWIGGGDYVDGICQAGDRRYRPSILARWALGHDDVMKVERKHTVGLLSPIAKKCVGLLKGNHEWAAEKFYARDLYWEIVLGVAEAAEKPPEELAMGVEGFVRLLFRRGTPESYGGSWMMTIYCHHGFGGGRLPGGHALALGRVLGDYQCDLALMGHRHTEIALPKTVTGPRGRSAHIQKRIAAFVPGYLNAYIKPSSDNQPLDSYSAEIGLPPVPIGTREVKIRPSTGRYGITIQNEAGFDDEAEIETAAGF